MPSPPVGVNPSAQEGSCVLEEIAIEGALLLRMVASRDERGSLVELLRSRWIEPVELVQWNVVTSRPGVLRGMHWHNVHHDLIAPVHGRLLLGLSDIRRGSPTEGETVLLELAGDEPSAALVPPGVAHGMYSPEGSVVMYGVSRYWDPDDEFGVRWDDPEVGPPWPDSCAQPVLSERDRGLPSLSDAGPLPFWEPQRS